MSHMIHSKTYLCVLLQ